MFEKRISIEDSTHLTLADLAGNAKISGWDQPDVWIQMDGDEQDLFAEKGEAGLTLSLRRSGELHVPAAVPVSIRQAQGNLAVEELAALDAEQVRGNLKLEAVEQTTLAEVYGNLKAEEAASLRVVGTVHGDANLTKIQAVDLQNVRGNLQAKHLDRLRASRVGGNLQAKEIGGPLGIDQVGGNALLKSIEGVVTLEKVAGNVAAKNLAAGATVSRIGGNLALNGDLGTGCTYHFKADGNAVLRLSQEANAHVTVVAGGKILSSLVLSGEERSSNRLSGTLGEGSTEIAVEVRGNAVLGDDAGSAGAALGAEISRQIEESLWAVDLEALGRQVSEEMESAMSRLRVKLESVDWERTGLQAQHAIERAMERMQRETDRMVEKAARYQERVDRRAEQKARRQERAERHAERRAQAGEQPQDAAAAGDDRRESAKAAATAADPVQERDVDEERLSILRMVEQGQISPEEAEMLLDALDEPAGL